MAGAKATPAVISWHDGYVVTAHLSGDDNVYSVQSLAVAYDYIGRVQAYGKQLNRQLGKTTSVLEITLERVRRANVVGVTRDVKVIRELLDSYVRDSHGVWRRQILPKPTKPPEMSESDRLA